MTNPQFWDQVYHNGDKDECATTEPDHYSINYPGPDMIHFALLREAALTLATPLSAVLTFAKSRQLDGTPLNAPKDCGVPGMRRYT